MSSTGRSTRLNDVFIQSWIVKSPPRLIYSEETERRTETPAWHQDKQLHRGLTLVRWTDFDVFIGSIRDDIAQRTISKSILCACQVPPDELTGNTVICGAESSVQAHFLHHIAKPLDSVMKAVHKPCQSGDFYIFHKDVRRKCGRAGRSSLGYLQSEGGSSIHIPGGAVQVSVPPMPVYHSISIADSVSAMITATSALSMDDQSPSLPPPPSSDPGALKGSPSYRRVPDIVCTKNNGRSSFLVGEVKVPWLHAIRTFSRLYGSDLHDSSDLRQRAYIWLAQICEYMSDLKLKYGFLTSYEDTVFLELVEEQGQRRLKCSPVVTWDGQPSFQEGTFKEGFSRYNLRHALLCMMYHCHDKRNSSYETLNWGVVVSK